MIFSRKAFRAVLCAAVLQAAFFPVFSQTSAADYYNRGRGLQEQEDWYGAIEAYMEALALNSAYGLAWQGAAECSYALGEYEQALKYLNSAGAYLKNSVTVENLKGMSLMALGRLDEARRIFLSVLARYPNDTDARFGLAQLDVLDGKISSAEQYYIDALSRQPGNRKALLSLAVISYELGKTDKSKQYISEALRYHGGSAEVHYFAGWLLAQEGSWRDAEGRVRSAIQLDPSYDEAYELLSSILFNTGRYQEVVDISDYRTSRDRNLPSAWYIKGLSLYRLGRIDEALQAFETGLQVAPEDEVMRAAAELMVCEKLDLEDSRRAALADYHIRNAASFRQQYLSREALYEYRRALTLDPYDTETRKAYAQVLLNGGYPQRYLDQLQFIQGLGKSSVPVNDSVESYQSLLQNSLPAAWGIDPFYIDKTRYTVGLYYMPSSASVAHPDAERITTELLGDTLAAREGFSVFVSPKPVNGYSEAFRTARQNGQDYFGLVKFDENDRDAVLSCDLYVARTGDKAQTFSVFRTGNGRYANAVRRMAVLLSEAMPLKGKLIARRGNDAVVNLGKTDGVENGQAYTIIKKGQLFTADEGIGSFYDEGNVLGTFTVDSVSEDISEGTVKQKGFYDRINAGDEILLVSAPAGEADGGDSLSPANDGGNGRTPALAELLQSIR